LEGQQSQSGFTRYVLALAAAVATPTASLLDSVAKVVGIKHLNQWLSKHLPQTVQAKRRRDLGRPNRAGNSKEQKRDNQPALAITTF